MNKNTNIILFSIVSLLVLSILSAYIIEYSLGHKPCKLCLYQRYPYFISIILILNILIIKKYIKLSLLIVALVSLLGSIIAFYHFGIEQGFFNESLVCEIKNLDPNLSKEDILKELSENLISCKTVTFRLFGLSLASINTIFSFVLFVIFLKLYRNYEINK
ncbi:MAG: disulfide bond formation protein B [Candidatus Marinimicrobia bacterium]|nr:disulfide bond formation protein B [Candidatus Neomarinimicrobiota bacterium]RPG04831.1 MAG: disulfide bond formation protein B [Pelagibacteraceae bacterium TMED247]|tara:strand:- start:1767 stop:2249 length:483 start_codon:yes stop_codon:yes gene_type:complete